MHQEPEQTIIEKAKHDPEAFGVLFDRYYPMIFNYALKRTTSIATAQDVSSEVFVKALKNLHKYENRGYPLSAWLYRITNNEIANHFNRSNHNNRLAAELLLISHDAKSPSAESELINAEEELSRHKEYLELHEHIARLPIKYQEVITLRYFENKQLKEISEILGKREGTIKSLLHRGLEKLRKLMEKMQPGTENAVMIPGDQS